MPISCRNSGVLSRSTKPDARGILFRKPFRAAVTVSRKTAAKPERVHAPLVKNQSYRSFFFLKKTMLAMTTVTLKTITPMYPYSHVSSGIK